LVTGKDPSTVAGSNCFVFNVDDAVGMIPTFTDEFSDATAKTKENNPENGGYLENIAPPPASIILASSDRLFLAGVAGDPHR
ncbi:hypothetical protein LAJ57_13670, partial [Streptococcus pneumoniae]|uniref:hypothetical protein n=1 Tax=Streptococcus pneumoniae TaxID=1313 RepID=UPI001CBCBFB9